MDLGPFCTDVGGLVFIWQRKFLTPSFFQSGIWAQSIFRNENDGSDAAYTCGVVAQNYIPINGNHSLETGEQYRVINK